MSERELRDEVEGLFDQVKRERAKLEASIHDEVDSSTAELCSDIDQLEARLPVLRGKIYLLTTLLQAREIEVTADQEQLYAVRSQISSIEKPAIGPDAGSWKSYEHPGCGLALWLTVGVGLSAAVWWLA